MLDRYLHVHEPLQPIGASWPEVRETKARWVQEFSRYDAGWSYIGTPFAWDPLDDRAAIPNRLGTYLLAGLPVITDRRPGFYRYDELHRLGVDVELVDSDYDALRAGWRTRSRRAKRRDNARAARRGYSFDATIEPLIGALEAARERYFSKSHAARTRFDPRRTGRLVHFYSGRHRLRASWATGAGSFAPLTSRALASALEPRR